MCVKLGCLGVLFSLGVLAAPRCLMHRGRCRCSPRREGFDSPVLRSPRVQSQQLATSSSTSISEAPPDQVDGVSSLTTIDVCRRGLDTMGEPCCEEAWPLSCCLRRWR